MLLFRAGHLLGLAASAGRPASDQRFSQCLTAALSGSSPLDKAIGLDRTAGGLVSAMGRAPFDLTDAAADPSIAASAAW